MRNLAAAAVAVIGAWTAVARPVAAETPPARWDPRVTKYVQFVEKHRKLEFEHPVPVKFLADKAFVKALQGDDAKSTKQDRADAERYAGQLRALGLIQGPVDLIQSERDLNASDVVGFYDQHKKRLFVRGQDLSDTGVRVTLVHELTHALQDQRFDLDKLDHDVTTSGEDFALTALVEGDAVNVEDAYLSSLPQSEQDDYDSSLSDASSSNAPPEPDAPSSSSDIPPILELFEASPYTFGPQYIEGLEAAGGGERQVDRAFRTPPKSEEEIIDPVAARSARTPAKVAVPKLAQGEKRDGSADDFGAMSLYLVLASRLDPKTAVAAAEGWGGDRYLAFTKAKPGGGRQECLRVAFRGDTNVDTTEIADALEQWIVRLPAGAASLRSAKGAVTLTACDTEGTTAPTPDSLDRAVGSLANRNDLILAFVDQQAPIVEARCVADRLVVDAEIDPLLSKDTFTDAEQTLVSDRISQYITACQDT
jgi:hypothetical protein